MSDSEDEYTLMPSSDSEDELDDTAFMNQLENDIQTWLRYCRIAETIVRDYMSPNRRHQFIFPTSRSGHIFMLQNIYVYPQTCYQEFRMYPPTFTAFTHILRDEYGLRNCRHVDVYEQVGMFLCVLSHGNGYRQVQTHFGHSLQTIGHYFKKVLRCVVQFAVRMIKPHPEYNSGVANHHPDVQRYPLFQDCIGAIDGTHVRAVLPRNEREYFIGRKGIPTQNVLAVCDFNLCFTFVLPGTTGNAHDSRILARSIHSEDINFPIPANNKYYLVDSGFAHRPGYMAPYKGSDIRYHFQEFRNESDRRRRRFRNARERFNFNHSSYRNVIERAFGVWKQRWKILDRMPSYSFRVQTAVVVATMAIHNFLRINGQLDEGFQRAEDVEDEEVEIDLPDEEDEIAAEVNAIGDEDMPWDQVRDYMAQRLS